MWAEWHFLRPGWFLALVPLALLLWRLARRSGQAVAVWREQVDEHLLPHLLVGADPRRRWPLLLLAIGWLLAVTALAGPVWQQWPEPAYRSSTQRVILLDLSESMLQPDLAPSRLVRARLEVLDLLRVGADGQTALIAFGAEPFLVAPLTSDGETIVAQVPSLEPNLLPISGPKRTDLALAEAADLLQRAGARSGEVILVTDGIAQPASAFAEAADLARAGHRLSLLWVTAGNGRSAASPGREPAVPEHAPSRTSTDLDSLRRLVTLGGGRLVVLTADEADTRALLGTSRAARTPADDDANRVLDQWREEGPWLLLLLLPLAALAFRRGWLAPSLAVLCLLPSAEVWASGWADLWLRTDQQGARKLAEGHARDAAAAFSDPHWRAAARYQAGDYAGALDALAGLDGTDVDYNRGNALARAGQLAEAIEAYDRVLAVDPAHADARHNRDLLQDLLASQAPRAGDAQSGQASDRNGAGGSAQPVSPSDAGTESTAGRDSQASPQDMTREAVESHDRSATGAPSEHTEEPKSNQTLPDDGKSHNDATRTADTEREPRPEAARSESLAGKALKPGAEPGLGDLLDLEPASEAEGGVAAQVRPPTPTEREARQAFEQMLRRVPDDPAGLLRQRFLLQHLRRHGRL